VPAASQLLRSADGTGVLLNVEDAGLAPRLAVAPQAARAASQFAAGQPVATAAVPATRLNAAAKSVVPSVLRYNDRQDAMVLRLKPSASVHGED
jgi:hypothetical protein